MAKFHVTIVSRQRWWLKYYLAGVMGVSHLTGRDPDSARVRNWIERGIVIEVH
ncbi:hypothetical protein [Pseudomonas fulva]|uniref:hypothetical protein n=1 Tax=Pseudomonas fulva TaxID=47880 RepID=UPI0037F3AEAB